MTLCLRFKCVIAIFLTLVISYSAYPVTMGSVWNEQSHAPDTELPQFTNSIFEYSGAMWSKIGYAQNSFIVTAPEMSDWRVVGLPVACDLLFPFSDHLGIVAYDSNSSFVFSTSQDGVTWTERRRETILPPKDASKIVFKDKLYFVGGGADESQTDRHEVWSFDPTDGWTLETDDAPWGNKRYGSGVVIFNDYLYFMGGLKSHNFPTDAYNDIYRTSNGRDWEIVALSALWPRRSYPALTPFNNKLWLFGGKNGSPTNNIFGDLWNSSDGITWEKIEHGGYPPPSTAILFSFDDKLWLHGARDIDHGPEDAWSSTDGSTWDLYPNIRPWYFRSMMASLSYQNAMWIIGGIDAGGVHDDVWRSADGQEWQRAVEHAGWDARRGHKVVEHQGALWLVGGSDGTTEYNDVWRSIDGEAWTQITSAAPFSTRYFHGLTSHDGKLWVLGGRHEDAGLADVWSSENGSDWSLVTDTAPWRVSGFGCTTHLDRIYVIGGRAYPGELSTDTVWSSADGLEWTKEGSSATTGKNWPPVRENPGLISYGGQLWLSGGHAGYFESLGQVVYLDDIWSSSDGKGWRKIAGSRFHIPGLPWDEGETEVEGEPELVPSYPARQGHGFLALDDKLWILGGEDGQGRSQRYEDVWFSEGSVLGHTADLNNDSKIDLDELLRTIQIYNSLAYHCAPGTEDNYAPSPGDTACEPHSTDYAPQDWTISLDELLRAIQFYNTIEGYHPCPEGEDGFCLGVA